MCVFDKDRVNFFFFKFYVFSQKEERIFTPTLQSLRPSLSAASNQELTKLGSLEALRPACSRPRGTRFWKNTCPSTFPGDLPTLAQPRLPGAWAALGENSQEWARVAWPYPPFRTPGGFSPCQGEFTEHRGAVACFSKIWDFK